VTIEQFFAYCAIYALLAAPSVLFAIAAFDRESGRTVAVCLAAASPLIGGLVGALGGAVWSIIP